ncbi:MAG: Ku protein [Acidobacteriota bacterium]|nr:Ku protein [Acidobacteriota bacterium]
MERAPNLRVGLHSRQTLPRSSRERVKFHRLSRANASRVRQQLVSEVEPEPAPIPWLTATALALQPAPPPESRPLPRTEIVKGYEYEKDRYVTIEDRELDTIEPKTSREMEIVEFVKFAEIDPVYLETSYYVAPDQGGEKPYSLLFGALRQTGYVALARIAMHNREHVAVIRPGSKGILMHTMYFADEVRKDQEFQTDIGAINSKEMDLAILLIDALAASFEPEKFKDTYREKLQAMIDAKIRGEATVEPLLPRKSEVIDIVAALKNSLAIARKPVASEAAPAKSKKRKASGQ